jgi:hypothetical protein
MPTRQTPQVVLDLTATFMAHTDPTTGWERAITGTYQTIADTVNAAQCTCYSVADIAGALTWMHEYGPDELGATVTKAGPGNRKATTYPVRDGDGWDYQQVDGSVYILAIDGHALPNEQVTTMLAGTYRWTQYQLTSVRNDVIDLSLTRGAISSSTPEGQTLRRKINAVIREKAAEITTLQSLSTMLETQLPAEMLA